MNPSNNNDDQGHMPSSSTHPKQEPMSGDEDTDSEGSFDDDDDDDDPMNDHGLSNNISDELAAQLASAGPTGVAAAAAISSTKKRKRPHAFETNPSIRKRQQTRLLRKLRQNIEEYSLRVGQQAVVLVATPGKAQNNFRVFGAKPLEDVVKNLRAVIMSELENALALQAPPMPVEDPTRHEMPPLVIDGIPTPVEKMTQAQLRAFIPLMLKYSTGRGKPGWGKETTKPIWWPKGVPWANVRMDARDADDKQKVSWTHALRQIVINCYKYHGREDLLPVFQEDDNSAPVNQQQQDQQNADKKPRMVVSSANPTSVVGQYTPTVVQTIANPDGTVSIIQVDPNNSVITLPDGTTAQVQGVAQMEHGQQGVQTLAEVASQHHSIDISQATTGELQDNGHIIFTSDDGQAYPISGMITVPVSAGAYQAVIASMQQGGGLTFLGGDQVMNGIQIISTPMQLANGQLIAKIEPSSEERHQTSIQNLVTKVMGQQSIHASHESRQATLTITPVASAASSGSGGCSNSGPIIQMVGSNTRLRSITRSQQDQPDTTDNID